MESKESDIAFSSFEKNNAALDCDIAFGARVVHDAHGQA
jgi:hypothetical protein